MAAEDYDYVGFFDAPQPGRPSSSESGGSTPSPCAVSPSVASKMAQFVCRTDRYDVYVVTHHVFCLVSCHRQNLPLVRGVVVNLDRGYIHVKKLNSCTTF